MIATIFKLLIFNVAEVIRGCPVLRGGHVEPLDPLV